MYESTPNDRRNRRLALLLATFLPMLCLLPFLSKAFHIDDPMYIWVARQIRETPTDFYGFHVHWNGEPVFMAEENRNPPAVSYYIALAGQLLGWTERPLHGAFLLPAGLLGLGVYLLAARWCRHPLAATCIMIFLPVFLTSSSNIMADTLMLALYVWTILAWSKALDKGPWILFPIAASLAGVAILTKYFAITILPLLIAHALLERHPMRRWAPALLIPVAMLGAYEAATYSLYGFPHFTDAIFFAGEERAVRSVPFFTKTLTGLSFTGGLMLPAILYAPFIWSRRRLLAAALAALPIAGILTFIPAFVRTQYDAADATRWDMVGHGAVFVWAGLVVLAIAAHACRRYRDVPGAVLLLWTLGTFFFSTYLNWSVTARTIFPMVPAVAIQIVRCLEWKAPEWSVRDGWKRALPLIPAALLAFALAASDMKLAGSAQTAAIAFQNELQGYPGKVYYQGSWGFQYYMENAGFSPYSLKSTQLQLHDIVIVPANNSGVVAPDAATVRQVRDYSVASPNWISTMNPYIGSGFYSSIWGPLPYVFGEIPPETYRRFLR